MAAEGGGKRMDYRTPMGQSSSRASDSFRVAQDQITFFIRHSPQRFKHSFDEIRLKYGNLNRQLEGLINTLEYMKDVTPKSHISGQKIINQLVRENQEIIDRHNELQEQKLKQEEHDSSDTTVIFTDTAVEKTIADFEAYLKTATLLLNKLEQISGVGHGPEDPLKPYQGSESSYMLRF